MPRNPNDPFEIVNPPKRPLQFDQRLGGASFNKHTKPIVLPTSAMSPHWLQIAQQIIHMPSPQRKLLGREKMNHLCTQTLKALVEQKVRGKGYNKLKDELLRIRK